MIRELHGYDRYVLIEGLTADKPIRFEQLMRRLREEAPNSLIQIMDGRGIVGFEHVFFAVLNSLKASRNNRMICDDLNLEIIVYASAQRQIKNGIEMLGVREDSKQLVLTAVSGDLGELLKLRDVVSGFKDLHRDSSVFTSWSQDRLDRAKRIFGVSDAEFESVQSKDLPANEILEKLVIEKMALLSISV
ncbi:MAG: KEOPS complex subunit Cgi121 [Candidatus Bathyarchaeia archaeon]